MDQPLLPTSSPAAAPSSSSSISNAAAAPATATPSSPSFLRRLFIFLVLAGVALWANYEASKGFDIAVLGASALHGAAARRFDLLFVSNGRAARLVLVSSDFVQRVLYPDDSFPRKPVSRVTLYMADNQLGLDDERVVVSHGSRQGEFVVQLSPAVMEAGADVQAAVAAAVQRGVARVWLWDGRGQVPRSVLDAMADYLTMTSDPVSPSIGQTNSTTTRDRASCPANQDQLCVARLNRAMEEKWSTRMLEDACGSPAESCVRSSYLQVLIREHMNCKGKQY